MEPRVEIAGIAIKPWFKPEDLPATLRDTAFKFVDEGAKCTVSYPGLFAARGTLGVVLPRVYRDLGSDDSRVDIAGMMLRLLVHYLRDKERQESVVKDALNSALVEDGTTREAVARIEVALQLWDDFLKNGPLPISARDTGTRITGRIHWPATVAHSHVVVGNHTVVYTDPVQTRFAVQPNHELTALHVATAREAGAWLGWAPPPPKAIGPREALTITSRYARTLYQDRQKRVCAWLKAWYDSTRSEGRSHCHPWGIFAKNFPLVWERMLFVALGSVERTTFKLPGGRYRNPTGPKESRFLESSTSFRPDIILECRWDERDACVVLDAKDYREGSVPKDDAVRKQILYRLLMSERAFKKQLPPSQIGNGFLAPAHIAEGDHLAVVAIHDIEGQEEEEWPLGRIVCIEVDFRRVAAAYTQGVVDAELRGNVIKLVMQGMSSPMADRASPGGAAMVPSTGANGLVAANSVPGTLTAV